MPHRFLTGCLICVGALFILACGGFSRPDGPHIGIGAETNGDDLVVVAIMEDSPAEDAGILVGDVLVTCNQQAVSAHEDLQDCAERAGPGRCFTIDGIRDGQEITISGIVAKGAKAERSETACRKCEERCEKNPDKSTWRATGSRSMGVSVCNVDRCSELNDGPCKRGASSSTPTSNCHVGLVERPSPTPQSALAEMASSPSMELELRSELPVWVICTGAHKTKKAAEAQASSMRDAGLPGHIFYLPDYPETTSGRDFWVTYAGPFPYIENDTSSVRDMLRFMQDAEPEPGKSGKVYKDAYALKIADHGKREEIRTP